MKGSFVKKIMSSALVLAMVAPISNVQAATGSIDQKIIVNRFYGSNRYETAQEVSFSTDCTTLIIVNGANFPDALSASALGKKENGAIVLVDGKTLDGGIQDYLYQHPNKFNKAIIVGGNGAVSTNVESKVKTFIPNVVRLAGSNRYDTSLKVAEYIGNFDKAFVATGSNFADALSVGSVAAKNGYPIILTDGKDVSPKALELLKKNNVKTSYIVGGSGVVSDNILNKVPSGKRLSGKDRYETNLQVVREFSSEFTTGKAYVATGTNFPDALAASTKAGKDSAPIILTGSSPSSTTQSMVAEAKATELIALGGYSVINMTTMEKLAGRPILSNSAGTKSVAEIEKYLSTKGFVYDAQNDIYYLEGKDPVTGNPQVDAVAVMYSYYDCFYFSVILTEKTSPITKDVLKMALPNNSTGVYQLLESGSKTQELFVDGKCVIVDKVDNRVEFFIDYNVKK